MSPRRDSLVILALTSLLAACNPSADSGDAGDAAAEVGPDTAIAAAEAAVQEARAHNWIWNKTEALLAQARAAAEAGEAQRAQALAEQARTQAEGALNQYYLEQARSGVNGIDAAALDEAGRSRLEAARAAIGRAEGKRAWELYSSLGS